MLSLAEKERSLMKKVILMPFILLCIILFTIPAYAMKNEPDNFRGIPWGIKPPKNNLFWKNKWGLSRLGGPIYWRDEDVSIGGAKILSPINYLFDDSLGFGAVEITFSGIKEYELIRKTCIEEWGKPDYEKREKNKEYDYDLIEHIWIGKRITARLKYYYEKTETGLLSLSLNGFYEALHENIMKNQQ